MEAHTRTRHARLGGQQGGGARRGAWGLEERVIHTTITIIICRHTRDVRRQMRQRQLTQLNITDGRARLAATALAEVRQCQHRSLQGIFSVALTAEVLLKATTWRARDGGSSCRRGGRCGHGPAWTTRRVCSRRSLHETSGAQGQLDHIRLHVVTQVGTGTGGQRRVHAQLGYNRLDSAEGQGRKKCTRGAQAK
jgi:hypothetical protein